MAQPGPSRRITFANRSAFLDEVATIGLLDQYSSGASRAQPFSPDAGESTATLAQWLEQGSFASAAVPPGTVPVR
jgi:hypothetical protein